MNQPIREALPTPTGWLVAPTRDFCLFFIRDPKSVMVAPTVFTQLWYCTEEGIPTRLKNTRRLDYESAHETWNELLSNDWELVEHQFGAWVASENESVKISFIGILYQRREMGREASQLIKTSESSNRRV